jgi:hypothetical protein
MRASCALVVLRWLSPMLATLALLCAHPAWARNSDTELDGNFDSYRIALSLDFGGPDRRLSKFDPVLSLGRGRFEAPLTDCESFCDERRDRSPYQEYELRLGGIIRRLIGSPIEMKLRADKPGWRLVPVSLPVRED